MSNNNGDDSSPKRRKTDNPSPGSTITVLNFSPNHQKNVTLQLLSSHTVYHLVSTLCRHTSIGGPDEHMWLLNYNGKEYESGDMECMSSLRANRTQLKKLKLDVSNPTIGINYDYGAERRYGMRFLGEEELVGEDKKSFPRKKPVPPPSGFTKHEPDGNVNLDNSFPNLSKWIFRASNAATLHFFQPGKKKNWGFLEGSGSSMLYLPAKPSDLNRYLSYLDQGAACPRKGMEEGGDGYPHHSWHSVVVLPPKCSDSLERKYERGEEPGFCDCIIANDDGCDLDLKKVFPKISALAGWKKDPKVPKGWMTVVKKGKNCSITIYRGNTHAHKNHAPSGTAFDGDKQHDPVEDPLADMQGVEVGGLQDLFCAVEGLLMTL